MCEPASMIVCKDRIFWSPTTDSHEEIIREFGLCPDNGRNAKIVRVEIRPPDGRLDSDPSTWVFKTDQTDVPEWYDAVEAERLCRLELPAWKAAKVFTDGEHVIREGQVYLYGTAKAELRNRSSARLCDRSSAVLYGSSSAVLYGSSSAKLWDSSSAELWDSSLAVLRNSSSAELCDRSSAELYDSSSAELCDSSSAEFHNSSSAVVWGCKSVTIKDDGVVIRRDLSEVHTKTGKMPC